MKAVTLRNVPKDLARVIRQRAEEGRTSINKALISLLEEGSGTRKARKGVLHHDLDHLSGAWSKDEASTFERALAHQRGIDAELWG